MAHFYGTLRGRAGEATRIGSKKSGIVSTIETWGCELRADLDHLTPHDYDNELREAGLLDEDGGMDMLSVRFGRKNQASIPLFTLRNPDATAAVSDDEKIRALFDQMMVIARKIEAETPKARKRRETAHKRRERDMRRQVRRNVQIVQTIEPQEVNYFAGLVRGIETEEDWRTAGGYEAVLDSLRRRADRMERVNGHLILEEASGGWGSTMYRYDLTTGTKQALTEEVTA